MPKIKVLKTGEEVEVGVATAGHMIQGGYAVSAEPPARKVRTHPQVEDTDLSALTKAELVVEADSLGVDSSGTKAEILDRIEQS